MANPLLSLLSSDPATLKSIIVGLVGTYIPVLGMLGAWFHHYYKGRLETSQQRITLAGEQLVACRAQLDEAKAKLDEMKPGAQLAAIKEHQALVSETSGLKIRTLEEEVSRAETRMRAIEAERDSAVATNRQRQDQAAELARLGQEKAIAEARIQELQGFIEQAHHHAEGLRGAALRRAARERKEYELKKDTIQHRFVKAGDARGEFETLHQRAASDGRIDSGPVKVDFFDHSRNTFTQVTVVGHDWYLFMQGQEGWSLFKPSHDDYVTPALVRWVKAYAEMIGTTGGRYPDYIVSVGTDCIEIHLDRPATGVRHTLAVLATIRGGVPTPMAHYLAGPFEEVQSGVASWRREHGTGMG